MSLDNKENQFGHEMNQNGPELSTKTSSDFAAPVRIDHTLFKGIRSICFDEFEECSLNDSTISQQLSSTKLDHPKQSHKRNSLSRSASLNNEPFLHQHGCIVAAAWRGSNFWPGIVIDHNSIGAPTPKLDHAWILWFNENTVSEVAKDRKIRPFSEVFNKEMLYKKNRSITKALFVAYKEIYFRYFSGSESFDASQKISDAGIFDFLDNHSIDSYLCSHDVQFQFSPTVKYHLKVVHGYFTNKNYLEPGETLPHAEMETHDQIEPSTEMIEVIENWKSGKIEIDSVCISCWKMSSDSLHPLFHGSLCASCLKCLMETFFAICDADGCYAFCAVCGNGGELLICNALDCRRVYCSGCMKNFHSPQALERIIESNDWKCELCNEQPSSFGKNGYLVRRDQWQQSISKLFMPKNYHEITELDRPKRSIRVLSLFDGISTAKVILNKLKLDVEAYFASEIEQHALNVSQMNFNDIVHLGDIKNIDQKQLESMMPIDLVLGGSPCNDFSAVNPLRKGIYDLSGTGPLFFEFYRILSLVKQLQPSNVVFWVFENVASMSAEVRQVIDRFLDCSPALWDSVYFSPQHRARLLWGNIPGLYSPPSQFYELNGLNLNLNDVLIKNLNRKAKIPKLRTITTMSNSLTVKSRSHELPVEMNGQDTPIWVTELERVFGFPTHYTDTGYLSAPARQKLLGKSWSVDVFKHLLQPLTQFFLVKNSEPSQEENMCSQ